MNRLIPLVLVLMTVTSCATMVTHETAEESLRESRTCCESFAQLGYDQLAESGTVSFNLDASSRTYNFQTGKSYFKAFRLPARHLPYHIRISSFALGEVIMKAHIFDPQIALLDDHYAIIKQSIDSDFFLKKAGMKETLGLPIKLEGDFLIDEPNAQYLLVFTTQEKMRATTPYETYTVKPVILPGLVTAIPTGKEAIQIPHSPFGLLQLEVIDAMETN